MAKTKEEDLNLKFNRCPLCGKRVFFNKLSDNDDLYGNVECRNCGLILMGADFYDFDSMVRVWNTRIPDSKNLFQDSLPWRQKYVEGLKKYDSASSESERLFLEGKLEAYEDILGDYFQIDEKQWTKLPGET